MNLPNRLTLGRLVLTVAFLGVVFWSFPFSNTCSLVLFVVASVTDILDGRIARRHRLITDFGILMDPLADKILICSAFIAFVGREQVAAWMVVIIVARELAITGLRLLAASKQVVLAAEGYGKHKTFSQVIAIISVLVLASYPEWGEWGKWLFHGWVPAFAELAKWVAVALTLVSGALYLSRNRNLFLKDL
ncbi:MAG: CDP-diacylglycerol--glycerol-3-phosphate 3-phosphatidyltransferase [Verrucomicrobia bacterium]|nr:CDP-diacylglycerol--glycerol-3-phosphate 3-phosphatidyltransferase [Verrucomicrobiota bacterium]